MLTMRASLWPTMRALPVRSIVAMSALAATPAVVTAARGGHDFGAAVIAAGLFAGAGVGYALDDDAATLLAASPTSLARRRAVRVGLAAAVLAIGWAVAFTVRAVGDETVGQSTVGLLIEAATAASFALAIAASGLVERPGFASSITSLAGVLTVTALSFRYRWLPELGPSAHHNRWLWLGGAALAVAAWSSRDPASTHHLLRGFFRR
jgi:hypothetical protein